MRIIVTVCLMVSFFHGLFRISLGRTADEPGKMGNYHDDGDGRYPAAIGNPHTMHNPG